MNSIIKSTLFFLLFFCNLTIATPTLQDFLKGPDLISAKISPDGRYLAQLWNKDTSRIVIVKDLLAPDQPVIGKISDSITRTQAISWANNQRLLLTIWVPLDVELTKKKSTQKDFDIDDYVEFSRIVSTDIHLENGVVLLSDQRRAAMNSNLSKVKLIPKDPNHVLMTSWSDSWPDVYKVDLLTGTSELVTHGSSFTFFFFNDDLGQPLYRGDFMPVANELVFFKFISESNWEQVVKINLSEFDNEKKLDEREIVALDGQDLIYRKRNDNTGYYELIRYKSKEKINETMVSLPDQDVLSPITEINSDEVIGYQIDGDHVRNHYFNSERQKKYDALLEKLGDYDFSTNSQTTDFKKAVLSVSGADKPLSFYSYDYETQQLNLIGNSYSSLNSSNLGKSAVANYLTRDKVKIHSYILLPLNYVSGNKYPLIVLPHGGPNARDRANYDDFAQFLATRGYAVIKPNFRGSTGYGKEFEEAGYKQWGQRMQDDIEDATQFMIRKGLADPNKICIVGISFGGYAALMGTVKTPDLYRCGVSISGVTHLKDQISSDLKRVGNEKLIEKYWYQRIGNPKTDSAMLDANSPALLTEQIKAPLLIVASTKDTTVPIDQAKTMVSALKKNKKQFTFIKLEDSYHNPFAYKKDEKTTYTEVEKFLAKYLNDPEPNQTTSPKH